MCYKVSKIIINYTFPQLIVRLIIGEDSYMTKDPTVAAKYIFLDVELFTWNRSVEAQTEIIKTMNQIVSNSVKSLSIPLGNVIYLPTGDGICIGLINVNNPYDAPLQIAKKILTDLNTHNEKMSDLQRKFKVRIGLSANVDNLIIDINKNKNLAGAGINRAARVMSIADGNQILVDQSVYDTLSSREKYINDFRELKATIKHGVRIPVYQYVNNNCASVNTSIPRIFDKTLSVSLPRSECHYQGEALDELRAILVSSSKEICINTASRDWVFKLIMSLIAARTRNLPVRIFYYPPSEKDRQGIRLGLLEHLGCDLIIIPVGTAPQFEGVFGDPLIEESSCLLMYTRLPDKYGVMAKVYRGPFDHPVIEASYRSSPFATCKENASYVPFIKPISEDEMIKALRKVPTYRDCDISLEKIDISKTRPLENMVREFKVKQSQTVREVLFKINLELFEPAAVVLSDNTEHIIGPPVVEEHNGELIVSEGHSRLFLCRQLGETEVKVMVVRGVNKPLAGNPTTWDEVRLTAETSFSSLYYKPNTIHLARRIEQYIHWLEARGDT